MRVTLRPVGKGNWRPLVLRVECLPRKPGGLFRRDDSDFELIREGDAWEIQGRSFQVAVVEILKPGVRK